jgi:cytochrome c
VVGALFIVASRGVFAAPSDDVKTGQMLYEGKCGGCHSVDENRVGPKHRGVVGRRIASVAGFDYSPAIQKLQGVWTTERLDQWLQNPQEIAPGSKMFFTVDDPEQRHAILAYLRSVSAP